MDTRTRTIAINEVTIVNSVVSKLPMTTTTEITVTSKLIRVTGQKFCAGVLLQNDRVWMTAPILKYMMGWGQKKIEYFCRQKRWTCEVLGAHNLDS